jgi:hypothetical protein
MHEHQYKEMGGKIVETCNITASTICGVQKPSNSDRKIPFPCHESNSDRQACNLSLCRLSYPGSLRRYITDVTEEASLNNVKRCNSIAALRKEELVT